MFIVSNRKGLVCINATVRLLQDDSAAPVQNEVDRRIDPTVGFRGLLEF